MNREGFSLSDGVMAMKEGEKYYGKKLHIFYMEWKQNKNSLTLYEEANPMVY